ncbi:MAG: hypothetical protein EOO41_05250, partial [Methanobacteriota archaeon]
MPALQLGIPLAPDADTASTASAIGAPGVVRTVASDIRPGLSPRQAARRAQMQAEAASALEAQIAERSERRRTEAARRAAEEAEEEARIARERAQIAAQFEREEVEKKAKKEAEIQAQLSEQIAAKQRERAALAEREAEADRRAEERAQRERDEMEAAYRKERGGGEAVNTTLPPKPSSPSPASPGFSNVPTAADPVEPVHALLHSGSAAQLQQQRYDLFGATPAGVAADGAQVSAWASSPPPAAATQFAYAGTGRPPSTGVTSRRLAQHEEELQALRAQVAQLTAANAEQAFLRDVDAMRHLAVPPASLDQRPPWQATEPQVGVVGGVHAAGYAVTQ